MLTYRNQEIAKRDEEIAKRDDLLKVKDELIELGYQREEELQKVIKSEKRKKVANKWLYAIGGAVGGYFAVKIIK
jgi:TPP-dependent pyruvate/acetoin dehydrogenase alpha subunit